MTNNDAPRRPFSPRNENDQGSDRPKREGQDRDRGPRRTDGGRGGPKQKPNIMRGPEGEKGEAFRPRSLEETREFLEKMNKQMAGLGARRAALDVLSRIREGYPMDAALISTRTFGALEGSDRAFARHLVSTVQRYRGALDEVTGKYLDRPLPNKAAEIVDILRLAAAQSLYLQTPDHAAVSTATELAGQKRELDGYKGLVNAISRKIAAAGPSVLEKLPMRVNTPGWLWRSWERAYGPQKAKAIAEAHQTEAPLDLSVKPGTDLEALAKEMSGKLLPMGTIRLTGAQRVEKLPHYEDGLWWAQDVAATLPVRLFGTLEGKTIGDICAAPGGKTMQLAAAGAKVYAVDRAPRRMVRVTENLTRTKLEAETIVADALEWRPEILLDGVLLDAPCSATGTLRRNPDVAWSKTEDDLKGLLKLQANFIDHAITLVQPGGTIIYCTCSLQRSEGEDQITAALARHPELEVVPITPEEIGGLEECISPKGYLRTLPSHMAGQGGMDGFFAARLKVPG